MRSTPHEPFAAPSFRSQVESSRLWAALVALALGAAGCPDGPEPEPVDASRTRRDAYADDAYLDPTIDANLDAPAIDAFIPDLDVGRRDAPHIDAAPDAGPVVGCTGVRPSMSPCTNDEECRARGLTRCNLPIHAVSACPQGCFPMGSDCRRDEDCESLDADAGSLVLVCHVYNPQCACPSYVCEPACSGPDCPTASCATDGYRCPENSVCTPSDALADEHGCAPKRCTSAADCDCGFCTMDGLCANGVGTCE